MVVLKNIMIMYLMEIKRISREGTPEAIKQMEDLTNWVNQLLTGLEVGPFLEPRHFNKLKWSKAQKNFKYVLTPKIKQAAALPRRDQQLLTIRDELKGVADKAFLLASSATKAFSRIIDKHAMKQDGELIITQLGDGKVAAASNPNDSPQLSGQSAKNIFAVLVPQLMRMKHNVSMEDLIKEENIEAIEELIEQIDTMKFDLPEFFKEINNDNNTNQQHAKDLVREGIVKSEVRQSHSIFLRMFFENIQPVTRHYGAPWGAY
ncbi:MAG: hypothetical protein GY821_05215 [Gammaproteobacteria bacterium]|nr:hypothetical protein [Gammaproteobacteria bacterium]